MSEAPNPLKTRLVVMAAINVAAVMVAGVMLMGYLKFTQVWALLGFVVAMGIGFGAQVWFIAGLARSNSSGKEPVRTARVGKGA